MDSIILKHLKDIDSFFKKCKDLDVDFPNTFDGSTDIAGRNRQLLANIQDKDTVNILFIFKIQDGEIVRNEYQAEKLPINSTREEINAKGEELIKELYTGDAEGDWYWDSYYENMGKYYSYKEIPCDESFLILQDILN